MAKPDDILQVVAAATDVAATDIIGPRRNVGAVRARRVAAAVFKKLQYSSPEIGRILCRDHTSILHLWKTATPETAETAAWVLNALRPRAFSLRHDPEDNGWIVTNWRTGAEMQLPVQMGLELSAAISASGIEG